MCSAINYLIIKDWCDTTKQIPCSILDHWLRLIVDLDEKIKEGRRDVLFNEDFKLCFVLFTPHEDLIERVIFHNVLD